MHRNLDRRVEAIAPIKDERIKQYIKEEVLGAYLKDNTNTRILKSDGSYEKLTAKSNEKEFDSQLFFVGRRV